MPRNALVVGLPTILVAAGALCWLAPLGGLQASADPSASYISATTQLFDATPLGGVLHAISPAPTRSARGANQDVRAQIFDPDVFGGVRSRFAGPGIVVSGSDASQAKIEGRSVAPSQLLVPTPVREISPGPSPQCEPGPSTRRFEPQYGTLERNQATG
jgi:hypothetical protein